MWGEKALKELANKTLSYSNSESTQVSIFTWDSGLTRFATSYIHQNVREENIFMGVKCINNKRIGEAGTNRPDGVKEAVEKAEAISKICPPYPDFPGLPEPKPIKEVKSFFPATQEFTPLQRAKVCNSLIRKASGFQAYGSFSTDVLEICIANSQGLSVYNLGTSAFLSTIIMGKSGSGFAQAGSRDVNEIDYESVETRAVEKARLSQNPVKIEPGKYEVIFEETAVPDILLFLSWLGFNALRHQEGRSPLCGKIGKKIVGDNITIWDDGLDPSGFSFPFDFEGVSKKRVELIERGVLKGLVYDMLTAKKEGKESTGHSVGSPMAGAMPLNLFMEGGNSTVEDMISSTKKGIFITRLHYTNIVDPMTLTITGMTRDGTYLVEDGKITKSLKNLRFTQSILDALSKVKELSKPTLIASGQHYGMPFLYGLRVPGLKIKDWNFTGVTEH
ncbi:TldD/PmbA family protein [candidate division WOR-3 bacterium]|nr:TldD/PmbA family protein [candidate division WOR-3 bacterium]